MIAAGTQSSVRSELVARLAQLAIAMPFLFLGAWCAFWPGTVEALGFQPEHFIGTQGSRILIACFGAQAMLSGLFAAFSTFRQLTFVAYAAALLPFFWFNFRFTIVEPVFTRFMLIDVAANLYMLALCLLGWWALGPIPIDDMPIRPGVDGNGNKYTPSGANGVPAEHRRSL